MSMLATTHRIKRNRPHNILPVAVLLLCTAIVASAFILPAEQAHAFTPNYNSSNLIDNPTLLNDGTMSAGAIQSLLSNVGSGLAGFSDVEACSSTIAPYYHHCGQTISAAQIIYDSSQAYSINPRAILATLEKEQSLVTDPSPSPSQLNCAMGYNSCSGFVGFFTQVDNGTWQLRLSYELANGNSYWGYSPSQYACANGHDTNPNNNLYSTGLYPGRTVTFYDPGGTAETITIANAATASLYCYTPYVGPISVTGYSGSYNFVYYYELWFGSTQASVAYAWNYESQSAYSNSAMTKPLTGIPTVAPGGLIYAQVKARNVGYQTWSQPYLHLGTSNPDDRTSVFYDSSWLNAQRPASLVESSVAPGDDGTFNFALHAPTQTGTYREYFSLVDDGTTWLNDPGLYFQINVVSSVTAPNSSDTTMVPGQTITPGQYIISPDTQSVLVLQKNGNLVQYNDFETYWTSSTSGTSASRLVMQTDGNLVLYDQSGKALWDSQTQNNPGAWLNLQPDGNLVIYSASNQPLWSTSAINNPNNLSYVNTTMQDSYMFAGQSLYTANRTYRLVLQTDGNLVLYDQSGKALWATGTNGIPPGFLALQPDGNLVLYSQDGRPIWYTKTAGYSGDSLVIQQDGNLVLYSQYQTPLWDTQTGGMP